MNVIVTAYNPNWPALYEQEAQAIAAKGHSFGEWVTVKEPRTNE